MKDLEYYMNLEYNVYISVENDFDSSTYYVAKYRELDGLEGVGNTREEALEDLELAKESWFSTNIKLNRDIPEPKKDIEYESVKMTLRIPYSLNDDIDRYMKREGTSKNNAINMLLVKGLNYSYRNEFEVLFKRLIYNFYPFNYQFDASNESRMLSFDITNETPHFIKDTSDSYVSPQHQKLYQIH